MTFAEALKEIAGLSRPSKMPWWSWSISASHCTTGSALRQIPGSTCSTCYALKGNYRFPVVVAAHERREKAMDSEHFVEAFVLVLHELQRRTRKTRENGEVENRFRWFDAGDLQSLAMLEKINLIAERTPSIRHWLPTREYGIVNSFLSEGSGFSSNLTVRLSAAMVDTEPKRQPFGLPYSAVGCADSSRVHHCQALASQNNQCLECDMCWQPVNVSYPLH